MNLIYNLKLFSVNRCQSVSRNIPQPLTHGLIFLKSHLYIARPQQLHPTVPSLFPIVSNEIYRFLLLSHSLTAISLVHLAIIFLCLNRGGFTVGCSGQTSIFLSCQEIFKNIPSTTDGPCDYTTSAHPPVQGM